MKTSFPRIASQHVPLRVSALGAAIAGLTLIAGLAGCVSSSTTADSMMREEALRRQQVEQKAPTPDDRGLYLTLIREMQSKGLYYASLAHIDAFEQKYGEKQDIELLRGDALRETEQGDAALVVYRKVANAGNDGANGSNAVSQALHGIGLVEAKKGRYPEAIDALSTASSLDPTNVLFLNDLGYANLLAGNFPGARLPIAQAAELSPTNRKVLANLVLYLLLTGDKAGAEDVIVRAKLPEDTVGATRELAVQLGNPAARAKAAAASGRNPASVVAAQPSAPPEASRAVATVIAVPAPAMPAPTAAVPPALPAKTAAAASPPAAARVDANSGVVSSAAAQGVINSQPSTQANNQASTQSSTQPNERSGNRTNKQLVTETAAATNTPGSPWQLHSMMERFGATQ